MPIPHYQTIPDDEDAARAAAVLDLIGVTDLRVFPSRNNQPPSVYFCVHFEQHCRDHYHILGATPDDLRTLAQKILDELDDFENPSS